MLELTTIEAFSYAGAILSFGIGVGYKIALKNIITTEESYCDVLHSGEKHRGNLKIILLNGKRANNNCPEFSQSKNMCRLNNKKCQLID